MTLSSIAIPLLLMTQGFTLVINQKNGEPLKINADDIENIQFQEIPDPVTPDPDPEPDPEPGQPVVNNDSPLYTEDITAKSLKVVFKAKDAEKYYIGIVRRNGFKSDAELITYVNGQADAQRTEVTGANGEAVEATFNNLEPNTNYVVVAYPVNATDAASKHFTITTLDLTPNTSGTVFPAGVTARGGFYDIDKVNDDNKLSGLGYGWTSDKDMCWACTDAGLISWWLDDYKSKTGNDYPLTPGVVPAQSAAYSSPVMDVFMNAYYNNAGGVEGILWFMEGVEYNQTQEGEWMYRESYPHWKGGFAGMEKDEFRQNYLVLNARAHYSYDSPEYYMYTYNVGCSLSKGAEEAEAKKVFSEDLLAALQQGPAYASWGGAHAINIWGADYRINSNGEPEITHLYVADNTAPSADNDLQRCEVKYAYDSKIGRQKVCAGITLMDGTKQTVTLVTNIRG